MALESWREDRTYFHIAQSRNVHESTVYRTVRKVETLLAQSGGFTLPGKKQLQQAEHEIEVVVVDVSETPVERPQKNSDATTVVRRNGIRSNRKS